jgi:predicted dinucleotide-binding enzyme
VFLAGDDPAAKEVVRGLLRELGWPEASIRDLGGIVAARGLEMYLIFWIQNLVALGSSDFNIRVVHPRAG